MLPIGKLEAGGGLMKIPAKQFAKQAARDNESIPVVHEMKSIGPRFLFHGKGRLQPGKSVFFPVKRRVPHVDFVPDLLPFR